MKLKKTLLLLAIAAITITGCNLFEKPATSDLDTTYFPMALGYSWTYERTVLDNAKCDTFSIKVVAAERDKFGWKFKLEGGRFIDVSNPVKINRNKVAVFGGIDTVAIEPTPTGTIYNKAATVSYTGDELMVSFLDRLSAGNPDWIAVRKKGIGVVEQWYFKVDDNNKSHGYYCRLLSFEKNGEIAYKAEDAVFANK